MCDKSTCRSWWPQNGSPLTVVVRSYRNLKTPISITSRYNYVPTSYDGLKGRAPTHPPPPHCLHIQDFTYLLWYSVLSSVLVTCSLLCGFLISLWGVWRVMECGHLCVLMSALVYRTAGEKLLTSFMKGILLWQYTFMLSWQLIQIQCWMEG